jgi:hypothetical protein
MNQRDAIKHAKLFNKQQAKSNHFDPIKWVAMNEDLTWTGFSDRPTFDLESGNWESDGCTIIDFDELEAYTQIFRVI